MGFVRDFYDREGPKSLLARWMTGIDDGRPQRRSRAGRPSAGAAPAKTW